MDDIPNQRLEFWDDKHFQKAWRQTLYSGFEASKDVYKCHYCINRAFQVFRRDLEKQKK